MPQKSKDIGPKRIRVVQIIASPTMGGIENQVLALLKRYDRERFSIDVVCANSTEGALREQYLATGARLIFCRWSRYVVPYIIRLIKFLRREKYDVVHSRSAEVSGAAMLAARLAGVPNRIASYDHIRTQWRCPGIINRLVVGLLQRVNCRCATKIYGVSQMVLDVYYPDWKKYPEQFDVCYNGIEIERYERRVESGDVRQELGMPEDCLVVGHIGRFTPVKNHRAILEMAELLTKDFDYLYFLLVGDGELKGQIEKEAEERGLRSRFVFTGNREDVPRLLAAMDVFVMPSLDEGFGLAVAEAQLRALPVVASDLPSIREVLCPAMHKFCCQPRDLVGMAEQVLLLLKHPQLRSKLGREGREYVIKNFSIDKTVGRLQSFYNARCIGVS